MNIANQCDWPMLPAAIKIVAGSQHTHDDHNQHYENDGIAFQQTFP